MWQRGRGCGPGEGGVAQGVWQGGFKNYKNIFFFIFFKNVIIPKSIFLEKNIFIKGVWPGPGGRGRGRGGKAGGFKK